MTENLSSKLENGGGQITLNLAKKVSVMNRNSFGNFERPHFQFQIDPLDI